MALTRSWTLGLVSILTVTGVVLGRSNEGKRPAPASEQVQIDVSKLSNDEKLALSARWDLGYYLFQNQDYTGAAGEFEKLRRLMPNDPTLLALIGSCYSMSGRWSEGETALLAAQAQTPDDADVNGLLGQFYISAHQPLKGAFYLEQALRLSPELEDQRARLAEVYLEAGDFAKSRAHLEVILKDHGGEDFGDVELAIAYARCLLHDGKFKEALPHAQRAHKADPENPRYARVLGSCLMGLNRFEESAALLASSRLWLDGDPDLYVQLGEAWFQSRKWDEAEAAWLEGARKFPDSYALLSRLVEFYVGTARPQKAARVITFARMENPRHPGNLLLDARLGRKLGSYSAARMSLERLKRMACGPLAAEALWEEAQLDFETGRLHACGKTLDRLLGSNERKTEAHLLKAKLALKSGDLAAAQSQVLQAHETNPYNLKVYSLARVAFSAAQDKEKLAGLLKDAQSLMPNSDQLYALSALRADAATAP